MVHCVKSKVQKSNLRITFKSREKQNQATKKYLIKHKAVKECIEVVRKKKAFLESTISELVKDTDRFFLEAKYAEKHRRDETVVINVKLLQENSNG